MRGGVASHATYKKIKCETIVRLEESCIKNARIREVLCGGSRGVRISKYEVVWIVCRGLHSGSS